MHTIAVEEAGSQFIALVKEAIAGEEVIITQDNKPVIQLVYLMDATPIPKFGSAKGLIVIADDFEEPLDDFKDYM